MRLIDADALKSKVLQWMPNDPCGIEGKEFPLETDIVASLMMEIEEAPTIEPKPKTGKWIRHDEVRNVYGGTYVECSECGEKYVVQYIEDEKYCRNCGADMRGE